MLLTLKPKHIEKARSSEHYPHGIEFLSDPVQILDRCLVLLDRLGFETCVKKRKSRFSTTLFGHVFWSQQWVKKTPIQKAKVAVHETTHALQQSASRMALIRYPRPRQLWIAEVQASGAGLRALKQMGASKRELQTEAQRNANSIWEAYPPVRLIRKSSFDQHTVATLLAHVGL
jgi:hypothetical protein